MQKLLIALKQAPSTVRGLNKIYLFILQKKVMKYPNKLIIWWLVSLKTLTNTSQQVPLPVGKVEIFSQPRLSKKKKSPAVLCCVRLPPPGGVKHLIFIESGSTSWRVGSSPCNDESRAMRQPPDEDVPAWRAFFRSVHLSPVEHHE